LKKLLQNAPAGRGSFFLKKTPKGAVARRALYLCPGERTEPFMRQDRKTAVCGRSTGVRIITQELAENDAKKKLPGVDDTGETC